MNEDLVEAIASALTEDDEEQRWRSAREIASAIDNLIEQKIADALHKKGL